MVRAFREMMAAYMLRSYVEISFPEAEFKSPLLKMDCGENPDVLCDEPAREAAQNFRWDVGVIPAATETLFAKAVHLYQS